MQPRLLPSLSDLAPHDLAGVPDALALVRLGLAQLADVRGDLADLLLVDPAHREPRGAVDGERDAVRRVDLDRVAEPERELDALPLRLDAVADADDLQALGVPLVTPVTMLATSVRVSPCSERLIRSSSGRVTVSVPSASLATRMGSTTVCSSSP